MDHQHPAQQPVHPFLAGAVMPRPRTAAPATPVEAPEPTPVARGWRARRAQRAEAAQAAARATQLAHAQRRARQVAAASFPTSNIPTR